MALDSSADVKFEIGHVLCIDIVGYSKLLINEQGDHVQKLEKIVRGTEQFRMAEAELFVTVVKDEEPPNQRQNRTFPTSNSNSTY
jgi:hypothetical protein